MNSVNGWQVGTIDDLCNVEYGTRVVQKRDGGTRYPVYGGGGATFFMDVSNRLDRVVVSRFGMSEKCTRFVSGDFFLNDSGLTLSPKNPSALLPEFLDRQILSLNDDIFALGQGAAQKNLDVSAFRALRIHFPKSLVEQRRVVMILDEIFEVIATAKANTDKSLQNAQGVFVEHLDQLLSVREKDWMVTKVGDTFETVTGMTPPKSDASNYGDFMPLVKPPELLDDVITTAADGLSESGSRLARVLPAGSVLVSCIGNLGKVGLNLLPVACNQQINAILPRPEKALPDFMFFQAQSRSFRGRLSALASGATISIVNKSKFNSLEIVLPPLGRQRELVELLTDLRAEVLQLISLSERKLADLDELKKSLLQQAFSGQLTARSADRQLAAAI